LSGSLNVEVPISLGELAKLALTVTVKERYGGATSSLHFISRERKPIKSELDQKR